MLRDPRHAVILSAILLSYALPLAAAPDDKAIAGAIVELSEQRRGLCVLIGRQGNVAIELARASELLVYLRDPRGEAVHDARTLASEAGFDIDRVCVERGPLAKIPFTDNLVDIVVITELSALGKLGLGEALRALRPGGTILLLGSESTDAKLPPGPLSEWLRSATGKTSTSQRPHSSGTWWIVEKPRPDGTDDWSHWEKGPDNNPVSNDQHIKAPYMTQFLAGPMYIGMPSVTTIAGGRSFLAIGHIAHHRREWHTLNKLIARNAFNGMVLWERDLPEGYLVHRSAFIATKDVFYMIGGDRCLKVDPQTGKEIGSIRLPGVDGEWKWMAMKDGVLYVLAGQKDPGTQTMKGDRSFGGWSWGDLSKGYYSRPRVPFGFGKTLAAYDLATKKLLWKHGEEKLIDSRGMSITGEKIFLYCPEAHLRGLSTKNGKILWTNADPDVLGLIEQPGQKLTSTPGFRTACIGVATPDALIIQGQTRNNVLAVSTKDGYLLWTKKKVTNNPNAIFVDDTVILGVGERGEHVALEPKSGVVTEKLGFLKRACTRLTASTDSFFVRGEGTLRFDRATRKVTVDGTIRPACNDGAIPANGLLYLGPWQCDCNLSLIGHMARCSAGDFRFDHVATDAERLVSLASGDTPIADFSVAETDWPTYRGDNRRSASSKSSVAPKPNVAWHYSPPRALTPSEATTAGGLVFTGGDDGVVRAISLETGKLEWEFATAGPVKYPPTIWKGRAYVGSADGWVYALEAASGRGLWQFRAAPVDRHILVYGHISSTWPVNSGVLVDKGIAYFAAGIVDHDGTYVYAVDALTGKLRWQNTSSGHLNAAIRKGASVQGNLSLRGGQLLLASGNQVSPTHYKIEDGSCVSRVPRDGNPSANGGKFVGVFSNGAIFQGGRILHSSPRNVSTKGNFVAFSKNGVNTLVQGGIPPAWNDKSLVLVNFKHGKITCIDAKKATARIEQGRGKVPGGRRRWLFNLANAFERDASILWQTDLDQSEKFEAISLAVTPGQVVAVVQFQQQFRAQPEWQVVAVDAENGRQIFRQTLHQEPLPGGLLVGPKGEIVVTFLEGGLACLK
jgi:outer membrane protein assembly factor BamB